MRRAPKLKLVTASGPIHEFGASAEKLRHLFDDYGYVPTAGHIKDLNTICDRYLKSKFLELRVSSVREMDARLREYEKAADGTYNLAVRFIDGQGRDDIDQELASRFARHLEHQPPITLEEAQAPATFELLFRTAYPMRAVIAQTRADVDAELKNPKAGIQPGAAFETWLRQMKAWARNAGFTHGPFSTDSVPSGFARFLFALNRMFPPDLRDNVASEAALAGRLKKAGTEARRMGLL